MADFRDREYPSASVAAVAERAPRAKGFAFPNISWGAIFSGVTVGVATHLLLTLIGVAAGLSAVEPQSSEPVGHVPMMVGIWNGISMLISAFIGGYVAARSSGLTRRVDGVLHGFVAWGATLLLFTYLATTALGSVVGGAFSALGGGVKAATQAGAAAGQNGQAADIGSRIQSIITGSDNPSAGNVNMQSLQAVQQALRDGDRTRANNILVNQMGFTQARANQVINRVQSLTSNVPARARAATDQAVSAVAVGSWWLSLGILLSMAVGLWGGAAGARSSSRRRGNRAHVVTA
jgi:hypothetical protein